MKILIRILAVITGLLILATYGQIWGHIAGGSQLLAFFTSSLFGMHTAVAWALMCILGPAATIKLWQLKPSGRIMGIILFGSAAFYYLAGILWYRNPNAAINVFSLLIPIIGNLLGVGVLFLPQAKKVFKSGPLNPAS
jgi:hypothetical protein